jgi:L-rhamnose isomerase
MRLGDFIEREAQSPKRPQVDAGYYVAKQQFAELGIDADAAIETALSVPLSVHCWQADDVRGLETRAGEVDSGGLQATGAHPGAARTGDEIRQDFETAAGLIPGTLRFNLHAMYAETGGKVLDRDELAPEHFETWIDWCQGHGWGMDFNPTCFAHPQAADGLTLSHPKRSVRSFWIRHCLACRAISGAIARRLGSPCVCNIWIPDGRKDTTVDRKGPREHLVQSLDAILEEKLPKVVDTVESKLFGIGVEDYTVGSHEFYLLYAATRGVGICFDMGHFHPTETIADKISAALLFVKHVLIHASRGIRWDSDHVVRFTDDMKAVCDEVVRSGALSTLLWATDFFDASINRVAAWVIGVRALRKAILYSLLEPWELAKEAEYADDGAAKLALQERRSEVGFGAVWDQACLQADVPVGLSWVAEVKRYEESVLASRT